MNSHSPYRNSLKASTLVEALVALVIITLVMAVAATLFVTLGRKRPDNSVNLSLVLNHLAAETRRLADYGDDRLELDDGVWIEKHVEPYEGDTLLLLLEFKAFKRGSGDTAVYREIMIRNK